MQYELNEASARKVLTTVDAGLTKGLGIPTPGSMCVEAAVCYAMGLPHSDRPVCVGNAVRAFKIRLNDAGWSSNAARTAGMRKLAIAQLGSEQIDQQAFRMLVAEGTIRQIVPIAMRAAAKLNPKFAERLEAAAVRCEKDGDRAAAKAAHGAAREARWDAASDAAAAAAAAAATAAERDRILNLSAEIGLQALIALKSPGCDYLWLCDETP
jgi:hypothetical protein